MKINKLVAGVLATTLAVGGLVLGIAAPASAHNKSVTYTCTSLDIDLQNYQTIGGSEEVTEERLVTEAIPYQAAVYGPAPLITPAVPTIPAIPAVPAVPEVKEQSYTEFQWKWWGKKDHGVTVWSATQPTERLNDVKDHGQYGSWRKNGNQRKVVTQAAVPGIPAIPAVPAVPGTPAVYGPAPLISPEVLAVDAVYKTVVVKEAVAANPTPNSVTVEVDGEVVVDTTFGSSYVNSIALAGTGHEYTVRVRAFDDPNGTNGWSFNQSDDIAKCPPVEVTLPTLTVVPPTCDTDGTLPFLDNPAAQNPNGYEFPGEGFRVYISPAFSGPGTYTATLQEIGAGFDPAFPYGTKVVGQTSQTLVVEGATGYQSENPEAPCYVGVPPTEETFGNWTTPEITCENEVGDELPISRTVTTVTYELDAETGKVLTATSTTTETGVYVVTEADIEALDCPVPPVTPTPTPTPTETVPPVPAGDDEPLASTGSEIVNTLIAGALGIAALAGGILLLIRRRTAQV